MRAAAASTCVPKSRRAENAEASIPKECGLAEVGASSELVGEPGNELLASVFAGRAPVVVFDYDPRCKAAPRDKSRNLSEADKAALSMTRLPQMHFCIQTTRDVHEYNAVVNTFKMAGWTRVPVGSPKFAIYWGPHPSPEMLKGFNPFQKANHFPNSWQLGRKDLLGKNIHRMKRQFPKDYNIMPLSFSLPEDGQAWAQAREQNPEALWIWKPVNLSCGKGIRLLESSLAPSVEKKLMQRSGVVQRYVDRPLLINGFKFDLRLYVVVTSFDPLKVYINEEGLVRLATQKYRCSADSLQERTMHLTNYSVNKHAASYKQNLDGQATGDPTPAEEAEPEGDAPEARDPAATLREPRGIEVVAEAAPGVLQGSWHRLRLDDVADRGCHHQVAYCS
ncbi:TTLL5 [Symbiodinium natans]|uniref:Tubulin--tyrosine ligase-like protein 5 n=1 Tax=Symbiodinium natans TaxID=878477 RepID=A0A812GBS6_9DINO|nr:TTLL5 [Symbiodinium natans]